MHMIWLLFPASCQPSPTQRISSYVMRSVTALHLMNDKVHVLHHNASGFENLLCVFIASELSVITCHTKLSMPALLCTPSRHLNVYSSINL